MYETHMWVGHVWHGTLLDGHRDRSYFITVGVHAGKREIEYCRYFVTFVVTCCCQEEGDDRPWVY